MAAQSKDLKVRLELPETSEPHAVTAAENVEAASEANAKLDKPMLPCLQEVRYTVLALFLSPADVC